MLNERQIPTIAISLGDPAGVGPEVALKALRDPQIREIARWVLVGDEWSVRRDAQASQFLPDSFCAEISDTDDEASVTVLDVNELDEADCLVGEISQECGRASLAYVRKAAELCLEGEAAAMVTAPISKEAVNYTYPGFTGHTEYIAQLCGADDSRLMLANDQLRVVHVSTHCSLAEAASLNTDRILRTIELGHEALVLLGWDDPRVAVCGLNPHAGEHGMFGNDEATKIIPAIDAAQSRGINCEGPFPADTVFLQAVRGKYDLVVAMYHDQGHVPMKLLDFEHTVNVTLGLPIIRTSVDHGTAFDIAGKNLANADDMKTAMMFAAKMWNQKRRNASIDASSPLLGL